jgi:hypothetical protein
VHPCPLPVALGGGHCEHGLLSFSNQFWS